jgi:hypothetical protein
MIEPNQVLRQAKESTIVPSWEWEGRDEQVHARTHNANSGRLVGRTELRQELLEALVHMLK